MSKLVDALNNNRGRYSDIFSVENMQKILNAPYVFDLTENNKEAALLNWDDCDELNKYTEKVFRENNVAIAIGKYNEKRVISRKNFIKNGVRDIHIGLDISLLAKTEIHAPLDSIVHSFSIQQIGSSYGGVIILRHILDNTVFYTLYGHLSNDSIRDLKINQKIQKGEKFAELGNSQENGGWPPHLHLQIISCMNKCFGDFPGMCSEDERKYYLEICPNPSLIFNCPYYGILIKI